MNIGIDSWKAADLFEEWFQSLRMPPGKRISPLGQNYAGFDSYFIKEWLGHVGYNDLIDYHVRDTATAALFDNDRASFRGVNAPFPKTNLAYLASQLDVQNPRAHSALHDCLVTSEIYRRMLLRPNEI